MHSTADALENAFNDVSGGVSVRFDRCRTTDSDVYLLQIATRVHRPPHEFHLSSLFRAPELASRSPSILSRGLESKF